MRCRIIVISIAVGLLLVVSNSAFAESMRHTGSVVIPSSSVERPGDLGERAHTNVRMFVPARGFTSPRQAAGRPPYSGLFFETPASLACVYNLVQTVSGCNPQTVTTNATGGSRAIAVVDAYHDPHAAYDLAYFSQQFGLPAPNFQVVYAGGVRPPVDSGWEMEESMDIEWAHAMAPNAKIYLVEAASNSLQDLFLAVNVASNLVAAAGGGEVTMSWSASEFSRESSFDSYFTTPGVVYFASAGDYTTPGYPATSPNVVAAGGTTLRRNPTTGNFISEAAWVSGGSGPSSYEIRPGYQAVIAGIVGSARGVPDVSAVADPNSGSWVYDSGNGGWLIVGGTSLSSPVLAGIVNNAGHFAPSTYAELTTIYSNMAVTTDFNDISTGFCGPYMGYSAVKGWDFCTGVGSPMGVIGK